MKYEVILFDADETLFDFKKSEKQAFENSIREFNMDYDENYHLKVYEEINKNIWLEFEQGLITQKKLKVERFKRLSEKLNTPFDPVEFSNAYIRHLANASFLYEDSIELIKELSKNYKLAIVTNGLKDVQSKRIGQSVIAEYFDTLVISEEVQVSKPNPEIFEIALNRLNFTDKNKVLMIGDSLTSDIKGGINFEIDTCWVNLKKVKNSTSIKPTYEISNLKDLTKILNNK
ncbi:noncanonical pyrimidine nucleotidase, YjjG family [Clostridium tertium]|uniref:Pyrimidine 5'-nucleotidase YjjG n=1 Tax=Clostridium tertium TaxID=1559 RepID=A0A6N3FSW5_9CLOT